MNHDSMATGVTKPATAGEAGPADAGDGVGAICPVCGAALIQIRCKSICRSDLCVNRIVYSCCEF